MSRFRCPLVAALFLLSASPAFAAVPDVTELAARTWTEVRTEHFRILTDAPGGAAVNAGRRLEQFTAVLAQLHPGLRSLPTLPVDVYVFANEDGMKAFTPSQFENINGFATSAPGREVFVMNAQAEGTGREQVVCHEYTHLFLRANFAEMPIWLNEGLAEFYETFRVRGRRAEFGGGLGWPERWLKDHEYQDLGLLFAMNTGAEAYQKDNELRTTTYAEGWAIVHWLEAKPDRAAKFDSVLVRLRNGVPTRIAFRTQFPSEAWPQIVSDTRQYVSSGFFDPHAVDVSDQLQLPNTTSRTVNAAEALVRLGDLALALDPTRLPDAATLYAAALERDSTLATARAGAGYVADARGDAAGAELAYARAERRAPSEVRVALLEGLGTFVRLRLMLSADEHPSDEAIRNTLRTARARFERCAKLDGSNPEAQAGLGLTALVEGNVTEDSYRALASAVDALPARKDLRAALTRAREARERTEAGH